MDSVSVRNLEQIQETDGDGRSARVATLFLAGIGGAALVVAGVFALKQAEAPAQSKVDPLAALVARSKDPGAVPPETVKGSEVTFPAVLSDSERPTTALAAVKDERGRLVPPESAAGSSLLTAPPPAADKLPVVPLPVGDLLDQTAVTEQPKDALTRLATEVSRSPEGALVTAGSEGGFQLQIASFKDQADADRLVGELQRRGHRAYRQAAYVSDRGLWHRVRIGPFKSKLQATRAKAEFDEKERMSSFVVDPDRVKRQEELRELKQSKLAARARAAEE